MRERIRDEEVIWLVKIILANHKTTILGKGMPLGNITSQFLANIYLHGLDMFAKHKLKAKYYMRYVDDFLILSRSKGELGNFRKRIGIFLQDELKLSLHGAKTRIIPISAGVPLLGFRVFQRYKLLKKSNQNRIKKRIEKFREKLRKGEITEEKIISSFAGWEGYAKMANTFKLRKILKSKLREVLQS